jgi:uncharacterized membrane protein YeiB
MQARLQPLRLIGMVSSAIVWFAHFLLCYAIVSLACATGFAQRRVAGLAIVDIGIGIVTVSALALIAWIAFVSHAGWQRARSRPAGNGIDAFLALNSMMLCALSAVALIWVAFPTLMLPPCAA